LTKFAPFTVCPSFISRQGTILFANTILFLFIVQQFIIYIPEV
jgi:hypothetical protein